MTTGTSSSLADHHAVITGGGRGIGGAIAEALDALGARTTLMGRSQAVLEEKCTGLSQSRGVSVDVCSPAAVHAGFARAREAFGPVSILINNAGAAWSAPLHRTDNEHWQHMLDVNLSGTFYCCREVIEDMRGRGWGRIINIASIAGLAGAAYISAYCAAKHGVIGLTRSLAMELARQRITVNALCPGYTSTDLLDDAIANIMSKTSLSREAAEEQLKMANPQHRFIEPQEVAASAAWLCLPGS